MFEKIRKLKINFISFKEKKTNENKKNSDEKIDVHKVKEVRTFSCCSYFTWYRIYKFFN